MPDNTRPTVTELLAAARNGDTEARDRLVRTVYPELRHIAADLMRRERPGHTLQVTGLVGEVFVRVLEKNVDWGSRAYFFGLFGHEMRRVLVDYARAHNAEKRGHGFVVVSLSDVDSGGPVRNIDLIALDEALSRFEQQDPRASRVIELRYFAGLTIEETASVIGVDGSTVKRDWQVGKAWLFNQLKSIGPAED
jgi:RNA polymerase sigma factor (TIGR02999 family)